MSAQLPRPKGATSLAAIFSPTVRKAALLVHGAVIIRDLWYSAAHKGTFRSLASSVGRWMCGNGFELRVETPAAEDVAVENPFVAASQEPLLAVKQRDPDQWYVTKKDLAFFHFNAVEEGNLPGATPWEVMMEKDVPNLVKYIAWRRMLPCGKTEYKSVTIAPDATAEEFMDVYLDDDFRTNWDGMVVHHEVLEYGDFAQRQTVVRWIRRFPFKFLSDREYTIARCIFRQPDGLYGITKSVTHPRAPRGSRITKVDEFHSMWRSRTVACPWGSGKPACETLLLHHEQFKISEQLARFAVRHGMWPFIRTLASVVPQFVAARRSRCGSDETDSSAYGSGCAPNPPLQLPGAGEHQPRLGPSESSMSLASMGSTSSMPSRASSSSVLGDSTFDSTGTARGVSLSRCSEGGNNLGERRGSFRFGSRRSESSGHLKGLAAVALASGLAVLINRSGSTGNLHNKGMSHTQMSKRRRLHARAASMSGAGAIPERDIFL